MARRWFLFGSLLLIGLAGCGSDTQEILIKKTIDDLDNAANKIKNMQEELEKAKTDAGGDEKKYATTAVNNSLKNAEVLAEDLKKVGLSLAEVKNKIDLQKEEFTPEQQLENSKKYRARVNSAVGNLVVSRADLKKTIQDIEKLGSKAREALDPFQKKLLEADGQFESLVRPR